MEAVFLSFILMLSIFLGFELISKVPATLHTPLMSGANAISGITVLGALVAAGADNSEMATWLGVRPYSLPSLTLWAATWSRTGCWPCSGRSPRETQHEPEC